ncbi:MAG: hypothetical protein ACQKBW_12845, partial [Puniceicoccales bacterium]
INKQGEENTVPEKGPIPSGTLDVEFDFEIAEDGWYGLYLRDLPPWAREIYVDGKRISLTVGDSFKRAAELAGIEYKPKKDDWSKEANIPLKAGKHTIKFQRVGRMGFPGGFARTWEIRKAGASPADYIAAEFSTYREVRVGEPLQLSVEGGGSDQSYTYELIRVNMLDNSSETIETLTFPASSEFSKRTITIPTPEEGVFRLFAKYDDTILSPREFIEGVYYVVDTEARKDFTASEASKKLLYDIDVVALTVNGKPVEKEVNYWEVNGETRVVESPIGTYRETNDGRGPDVNPYPRLFSENFSGFGFLLDVPDPGKAYIVEIDHPDDAWRSVCGSIVDVYDWEKQDLYMPRPFGYETGGNLEITNEMVTQKILYWPNSKQIHLALTSSRIGKRAAASNIRIYEVQDTLPSQGQHGEGRFAALWMEEHERWHTHFNTPKDLPNEVRDWIGLNRTMEWIAYTGYNGFWPNVVAYQQSTYDSEELKGYLLKLNNIPRLTALLCEKYGEAYVTEIFLARQRYFNEATMLAGAENPEDLYTTVWWGFSTGTSDSQGGMWPNWNILHPHVQDKMIAIYGELADTLGDTESFAGMSGRLVNWQWDGLYGLTSLNWGYSDWTVSQFEKDTGIKVPGGASDPERFEKRFRFLTSPEMKQQWLGWRKARVTDFLMRLSARIREAKSDAVLFLCGNAMVDENHSDSMAENLRDRLEEMGIDLAAIKSEPGIAILPTAEFGRGKSRTYLSDQDDYDKFQDPEYLSAGKNYVRGFAPSGAYQEWGKEFPFEKYGLHPKKHLHYCSGSDAAGRNILERYSTVLAEQDTMVIRNGGYPILHGAREYFSEWMRAYSSLPRVPFDEVPFARDPVAVWDKKHQGDYLFYT